MGRGMPDYGVGRCDGHHEMIDFRLRKKGLRHAVIAFSYRHMLQRSLPTGFIAPCLPTKTDKLPSGSQWLHEINARKTGAQVRLYSRPGNDLTHRFPLTLRC
jgi:ATP-dependent DNA ligase